MTTALRPMSTSELLDRTFNLYRNNFGLFAGIATVPAIAAIAAPLILVAMGITMFLPGAKVDNANPLALLPWLFLYFLLVFVFTVIGSALATGATIYAVSKVHLGHPVSIHESYRKVAPLWLRILGILTLVLLVMIGVIFVTYVVAGFIVFGIAMASGATFGRGGGLAGLGLGILLIIPVVLAGYFFALRFYCVYSLSVPACMLENTRAVASLSRSSFLSKDSLWRIFLIFLLSGVIDLALSFALQVPVQLLVNSARLVATVWYFAATFLAAALSFPISTIAISLVYYDQRVRKEAFDLQLMMEAMGPPGDGQAAAPAPIG